MVFTGIAQEKALPSTPIVRPVNQTSLNLRAINVGSNLLLDRLAIVLDISSGVVRSPKFLRRSLSQNI
jgi:hypothetical protein